MILTPIRSTTRLLIIFTLYSLKPQPSEATYEAECHNPGMDARLFNYMVRIRPESKYGAMADGSVFSYDTAQSWCRARDMNLAQIRSVYDYRSLNEYLLGITPNCQGAQTWLIDGSDNSEEGRWKYSDGESLTFQAFYAFEPTDSAVDPAQHANYLKLICAHQPEQQGLKYAFAYRDIQLQDAGYSAFFCEYKKDSSCWKKSAETKASKKRKDELVHWKDIGKRQYYFANHMKTWSQAVRICKKNKMKLFDMELEDEKVAEKTAEMLGKFIRDKEMMSLTTGFILYGAFSKFFTGNPLPFEWEWIDHNWRDKLDTSNSFFSGAKGQMKFGKCISVGTLYSWSTDPKFTFSMAHCSVPHWTLCYKDKDPK